MSGNRRNSGEGKTWKYAGQLRVGDVWTEQAGGDSARDYRVIEIAPGPARSTITVTGSSVTTGQLCTIDLFAVNRVKVRGERA
jgi:hypothetical protein